MADEALFLAVAEGDGKRLQELLDGGADVNAFDAASCTPLMAAAARGDEALVLLLLDAGADPSIQAPDEETAYLKAAAHGQAKVAALLSRFAKPAERELARAFLGAHGAQVLPELPTEPGTGPGSFKQKAVTIAARAAKFVGHEAPAARVERLERAQEKKGKK